MVAITENCLPLSIVDLLIFSSPCQRQCELLPSLGVCRLLTFYILTSETPQPNSIECPL